MKGTIKLIPVFNPVEGMKVVFETQSHGTTTGIISDKEEWSDNENPKIIYHNSTCYRGISELQQIVVDYATYTEFGHAWPTWKHEFIPLHLDDWEYALKHIEEGVSFYKTNCTTNGYEYKGSPIDAAKNSCLHAKLIIPSPILYTEQETFNLIDKYRGEWGLFLADYWKEYGKTNPQVVFEKWFEQNKKK